ncbi:MAG: hypothetical protein OXF51_03440, partial [Alphaproteobacteria bacterium]|nr:hypothetical protein [Alphaproteobacteria bacterium]
QDIKRLLTWHRSPTVEGQSPLRLTETGQAASGALNLPSMAEKIIPTIKDRVADKIPYDVQEFCFEFIRDQYQPNYGDETRIKQYAYDNGLDRDDLQKIPIKSPEKDTT